jgi:hypothetical protein
LAARLQFHHFMAAFGAVYIFGGSGPAITAHGSLDKKFTEF